MDAPARQHPPQRRSFGRRLRRALGTFLAMLGLVLAVLALVLVGWVNSEDFQRRTTALVELLVERQTGEQATVNAVRIQFLPPSVAVDGFHLWHDETDETIASVERVRAPLVLSRGGVGVGRLEIQRPVIQLHVEPGGELREFANRLQRDPTKRGDPLRRLPFESIILTDGVVRLWFPDGEVQLEDIDLVPTDGPITDITGDLTARFRDLDVSTRLEWSGVTLGPEVISVPDLAVVTPILQVHGPVSLDLDGPVDARLTAHVALDELTPALTPPRALHGSLDLDLDVTGPPSDPTLVLAVLGRTVGVDVPGVLTPLLTYELGDINASAIATKRRVDIEKVDVRWGPEGHLRAWGSIDPIGKILTDAHVVGSRLSLAHVMRQFDSAPNPWVDMSTDLEVSLTGPLQPLQLQGPFELEVADLQVGDRPVGAPGREFMLDIPRGLGRGEMTLFKDHLVLRIDHVETPRNRGSGTLEVGFAPRGPIDIRATLHQADLRDFQPLRDVAMTGRGRVTGRFHGPFNAIALDGFASLDGFSVLGIPYADHIEARLHSPSLKTLELHDARATRGETRYHGDFEMGFKPQVTMDTDVVIDGGRVEDLVGMFIDLPGMKGEMDGTLSLHGPMNELSGGAHLNLRKADLWGETFADGVADGFMDQGRFTLDTLRLRRNGGTEGLTLRGSVERSWALNMELTGDGLELSRWDRLKDVPVSGRFGVQSRISGTLFDPSPDGRIVLTGVRYGGTHIEDSTIWFDTTAGVAHYAGLVAGGAITVDGTLGLWDEQPYALVADLERVPAHVFWPTAADGQPVRAIASGEVRVSGHFGEIWSPVDLTADLGAVEVAWDDHTLRNDVPWHYEQSGRFWKLTGFGLRGGQTDLAISAQGGDVLDLAGSGRIDLDLLRMLVPGVEKSSGIAEIHVSAEGTRPDVQAVVTVDLQADLLRYAYVPIAFEAAEATFRVTEDRIEIVRLESDVGGGRLVGGGVIDAVGWIPSRYALSAAISDAQVQWVDTLPPATGDATLYFDGPTGALLLSGDVVVEDMTFSDRIDWEDWVVETQSYMLVDSAEQTDESYFNLNIAILADHTIFLRNNVADGIASADLRIIGDTARPGLVGSVTVEPGSLAYLQDREFRLDRGQLLFNDPWTWDPDLDIDLVADILNQEQNYRVDYVVFGPFSQWQTSPRSDPPLPPADVNALLWFGVTTDQLEDMGQLPSAVVQATADLVLSDIFLRSEAGSLREELPDFLSPDRIDLATGVNARGEYSPDPRLVVEKRLEELGNVQLSWEMNLVRPEDNYVRLEQRIGGVWSLSEWYSTLQRARVLPIGGAYGVDVTARWELQ